MRTAISNVLSRIGKLISKGFTSPEPAIGQVKITLHGSGGRKSFEGNLLNARKTIYKKSGKTKHLAVNLLIDCDGARVTVQIPTYVVLGGRIINVKQSAKKVLTGESSFEGTVLISPWRGFDRASGRIFELEPDDECVPEAA